MRWQSGCLCVAFVIATTATAARSSPPDYKSFGREQRISYSPHPDDLLRICMVYIGQGDGLLVQLPPRLGYTITEEDGEGRRERTDILVDGGAWDSDDARRMPRFIERCYAGDEPVRIEYAVLSHHDQDHVLGLEYALESDRIGIDHVFHNGLASYRGGTQGFPKTVTAPLAAIYKSEGGSLTRGMAMLDGERMVPSFFVPDLSTLRERRDDLQGVYGNLGTAILDKTSPAPVACFDRAFEGSPFIGEREASAGRTLDDMAFEVLWPPREMRRYGDQRSTWWAYTINGNSATFMLRYRDFEMLFTGDLNDDSEEHMLRHYQGQEARLRCDVLKVPHHGSDHQVEPFFAAAGAVLGVCSMGEKGFSRSGYSHPSTRVIEWMGGSHRVYHTHIHERRFDWETMTETERRGMVERRDILVETDGHWFRVVELPLDHGDPNRPPTVAQTRRGDGTRWIRAKQ